MNRHFVRACASVFFLSAALVIGSSEADATLIVATANGSEEPPTAISPDTVINGDFTIASPNQPGSTVGDGSNENTSFTFDFTTSPQFAAFDTSIPLQSALVTLTITPTDSGISTDAFRLANLPYISPPEIQMATLNATSTISFDLLNYYSSGDILAKFVAGNGLFTAMYVDDAILSFARLELNNTAAVPEPSTILSASIASVTILGLALRRRKRSA